MLKLPSSSFLLLELEDLKKDMSIVQAEVNKCMASLKLQSAKVCDVLVGLETVTAVVTVHSESKTSAGPTRKGNSGDSDSVGHIYGSINSKDEHLVSSRPNLSVRRKIKAKPKYTFEDLLSPPSGYHVKHCRTPYSSNFSEAEEGLSSVSDSSTASASFGLVTNDSITSRLDKIKD